ncbi:hypothetical protein HDU76_013280 [Blyttiomyces sp. JEL0837]|nr:hypothetical protein HDU76_013280 [Blyttiomyces sp. JEL0837]
MKLLQSPTGTSTSSQRRRVLNPKWIYMGSGDGGGEETGRDSNGDVRLAMGPGVDELIQMNETMMETSFHDIGFPEQTFDLDSDDLGKFNPELLKLVWEEWKVRCGLITDILKVLVGSGGRNGCRLRDVEFAVDVDLSVFEGLELDTMGPNLQSELARAGSLEREAGEDGNDNEQPDGQETADRIPPDIVEQFWEYLNNMASVVTGSSNISPSASTSHPRVSPNPMIYFDISQTTRISIQTSNMAFQRYINHFQNRLTVIRIHDASTQRHIWTSELLEKLIRLAGPLTEIMIRHSTETADGWLTALRELHFKSLRKLDVGVGRLISDSVLLNDVVALTDRLESLGMEGVMRVAKGDFGGGGESCCPCLETLAAVETCFDDRILQQALSRLFYLRVLDLRWCIELTPSCLDIIMRSCHPRITEIMLSGCINVFHERAIVTANFTLNASAALVWGIAVTCTKMKKFGAGPLRSIVNTKEATSSAWNTLRWLHEQDPLVEDTSVVGYERPSLPQGSENELMCDRYLIFNMTRLRMQWSKLKDVSGGSRRAHRRDDVESLGLLLETILPV